MKRILFIFLFLYSIGIAGQNGSGKDSVSINENPSFPGGKGALNKFLNDSIRLPERWKEAYTPCTVSVKFTVNEDGTLSNIQILKGCMGFPECDAEVLRVIPLMPKWIPGKKNGVPVKRSYSAPFYFKIK